jgi:hypothetical protein
MCAIRNSSSCSKQTLEALDTELRYVREAMNDVEAGALGDGSGSHYEDPLSVMEYFLVRSYTFLTLILESIGLTETRTQFIADWNKLASGKGLREYDYDRDSESITNKPYSLLMNTVEGLRIASGQRTPTINSGELAKLEEILRDTAQLVHRRKVEPARELDVQCVMHDYLDAYFTEFKAKVSIDGYLKDFHPDCGIRNLKAAIEFKFVASDEECATALSGLFEDLSGYKGSRDWTLFYAVIYQTKAFKSQKHYESEFTRAGATNWKILLVTGVGGRKKNRLRANIRRVAHP